VNVPGPPAPLAHTRNRFAVPTEFKAPQIIHRPRQGQSRQLSPARENLDLILHRGVSDQTGVLGERAISEMELTARSPG
jgi:hypothetical protein